MFLKRNIVFFSVVFIFLFSINIVYYFLNEPKINQNYVNEYKNQYFLLVKRKRFFIKKLIKEKNIYNTYQSYVFSNQQIKKYKDIFSNIFQIFKSLQCNFFGITKDNKYFNVINIYYKCNSLKDTLISKLILQYLLTHGLNLKNVKMLKTENQYLIIQLFKY